MWYLPALLTIVRMLLAPVLALLLWLGGGWDWWAVVIFSVAAFTDFADGYVARRYGFTTKLGAFLDPLADKILTLVVFSCFIIKGLIAWWIVATVLGRDLLVTWLRICADKKGINLPTMWLAKVKTTVQFFVIYILFAKILISSSSGLWFVLVDYAATVSIYSMLFLAVYTGLQYCILFIKQRFV